MVVPYERGTEVRGCPIPDYEENIFVLTILMKAIQNRGILINGGQVTYSLIPAFYGVYAL